MNTAMSSRHIVTAAVARLFVDRDPGAIDEFFGPVYTQHSALGVDGVDGLRALLDRLPAEFSYRLLRVIADGDLVVTHGLYFGFGPGPVAGFDVWRVRGERIVEHWDALGPIGGRTPDDTTPIEGQTDPGAPGKTDENRVLITDLVDRVFIGGEARIEQFVATESHDRVRGGAAVGVPQLDSGTPVPYETLHQVIAQGDLVYTRAEGAGQPRLIINDLWRVDAGRIAEHWGLVVPVPATLPHDNGSF